jgi:hypothetical protein
MARPEEPNEVILRSRCPQLIRGHLAIGRTHTGTHVLLLVQDLDIRVIDAATGELLRELTIDPRRDYQPTGKPPGPTKKK